MTRREMGLRIIAAEVAETGKAGKCAIRAYVETRMSREAFNKACAVGLAIYDRRNALAAGEPVGPGIPDRAQGGPAVKEA